MTYLSWNSRKAAAKAYAALVAKLDANANIADVCEGTGPKDSREWYLGRGRVNGDPHGQAPLLWLCSAMLDKILQQPCRTVENIVYRPDLKTENCRLKMKLPEKGNGFATLVWFHGGGLSRGNKNYPENINTNKIAIATVNYRLSGKGASCPDYIYDAAAAVACVIKNIEKYPKPYAEKLMIVQENQIHYRGELKEASGWIGDFGEYFEWADGNPEGEDRVGYMV
mgnify:CR=1 FL=1